jgi:hypothetical protein
MPTSRADVIGRGADHARLNPSLKGKTPGVQPGARHIFRTGSSSSSLVASTSQQSSRLQFELQLLGPRRSTCATSLGPVAFAMKYGFDVRYALNSGAKADIADGPSRANKSLMHRSKRHRYSITLSARSRSDSGIARPSAFAVLRLMMSLYLDAWLTRRSAGLTAVRILST